MQSCQVVIHFILIQLLRHKWPIINNLVSKDRMSGGCLRLSQPQTYPVFKKSCVQKMTPFPFLLYLSIPLSILWDERYQEFNLTRYITIK